MLKNGLLATVVCSVAFNACSLNDDSEPMIGGSGGEAAATGGGMGLAGGSGGEMDLGGAGGGTSPLEVSIWNDSSVQIEIEHFSFFGGGHRFRKAAAELSQQQLALIQDFELVRTGGACFEDAPVGKVIVTDNEGGQEEFPFGYENSSCSSEVVVDYQGVAAFLATTNCLSAKEYPNEMDLEDEEPPKVTAGDGCLHGAFNSYESQSSWLYSLDVEPGENYEIIVEACGKREMRLTVLGQDDDVLASVDEDLGTCPSLQFVAPATGASFLRMEKLSGEQAGDFYFSLNPLE